VPTFKTADILQMEEIELSNINIYVSWTEEDVCQMDGMKVSKTKMSVRWLQ